MRELTPLRIYHTVVWAKKRCPPLPLTPCRLQKGADPSLSTCITQESRPYSLPEQDSTAEPVDCPENMSLEDLSPPLICHMIVWGRKDALPSHLPAPLCLWEVGELALRS